MRKSYNTILTLLKQSCNDECLQSQTKCSNHQSNRSSKIFHHFVTHWFLIRKICTSSETHNICYKLWRQHGNTATPIPSSVPAVAHCLLPCCIPKAMKKHLRSCVDLESFEPPLIRTVEVIIIFCTFCLLEIIAISPSVVDVIKASQISL